MKSRCVAILETFLHCITAMSAATSVVSKQFTTSRFRNNVELFESRNISEACFLIRRFFHLLLRPTLAVVIAFAATATTSSARELRIERAPEDVQAWGRGIDDLDAALNAVRQNDNAEAKRLIARAQRHFQQIERGQILFAAGISAVAAMRALQLATALRAGDNTATVSAYAKQIDLVFADAGYVFRLAKVDRQLFEEKIPELSRVWLYHDLGFAMVGGFYGAVRNNEARRQAIEIYLHQARFRAVFEIAGRPAEDAVEKAKLLAKELGLSLLDYADILMSAAAHALDGPNGCDNFERRWIKEALHNGAIVSVRGKDLFEERLVRRWSDLDLQGHFAALQRLYAVCTIPKGARPNGKAAESGVRMKATVFMEGDASQNAASRETETQLPIEIDADLRPKAGLGSKIAPDLLTAWRQETRGRLDAALKKADTANGWQQHLAIAAWQASPWTRFADAMAFTAIDPSVVDVAWDHRLMTRNLSRALVQLQRDAVAAEFGADGLARLRRSRNLTSTGALAIKAELGGALYDAVLPFKRAADERVAPAWRRMTATALDVDREAVRAAIRPGQMLVDLLVYRPVDEEALMFGPPRYGAFVLTHGSRTPKAVDLGPAKALDALINAYRDAFTAHIQSGRVGSQEERDLARIGAEIRKRLLDPIVGARGMPSRIYLAPAGAVARLPIEALPVGLDPAPYYLGEAAEIVLIGSPRDLIRGRTADATCADSKTCSALLVGDPLFDAARSDKAAAEDPCGTIPATANASRVWQQFCRLDLTGRLIEALDRDLTAQHTRTTKLTGPAATETNLYLQSTPSYLVVASHGLLLREEARRFTIKTAVDIDTFRGVESYTTAVGKSTADAPDESLWGDYLYEQMDPAMRAIVALAGASTPPSLNRNGRLQLTTDDGLLTAYEAELLDLGTTELVLLIGCETGIMDDPGVSGPFGLPDEATLGFRRALQVAGARSVISSLWPVLETDATAFTSNLFVQKSKGLSRFAAFREAQKAALDRAGDKRGNRHPLWWAGFVFDGDPGDLP
ncbi:MAG: CHAT domain-containing protein [Pseudomonadota bacterium]